MSQVSDQQVLSSSMKGIKKRIPIHVNDNKEGSIDPIDQSHNTYQRESSLAPDQNVDSKDKTIKTTGKMNNNVDTTNEKSLKQSLKDVYALMSTKIKYWRSKVELYAKEILDIGVLAIGVLVKGLLVFIFATAVIYLLKSLTDVQKPLISNDKIDCSQFLDLKTKYPQLDPNIFKSLKIPIEGLFNRNARLPVFMFFSTDQKILDDFIDDVVSVSKKCIGLKYDPINLTPKDLNKEEFLDDFSRVIEAYRYELEKRTIMVIRNLDELSTKVAPSLHSFTDIYDPLVEKSIIFLSIRVPEEPTNAVDYIFTHLEEKWNDLPGNVKNALITRLIDQTFFLKP